MTDKTHNNDLTGPVPGSAGVEANIENMEAMGFDPENLDMILNGTVEGLMSDYPALRNDDAADMMISKARSLIGTVVEYEELRMMYACALKEIKAKFDVLNTEFKVRYSRNPISFINTRLKKTVSISEKLGRKNLAFSVENIEKHINDVAGIRVICSYVDDIYAIEEALLKQSDVVLVCRKDYISAPKPNGYRSLHLIVKIPVHFAEHKREMKVEVQIRTIAMDFWASLEHQLKYKQDIAMQEEIVEELRQCADIINMTDERMMNIRHRIEAGTKAPTEDELMFEKLCKLDINLD